MYEIIQTTRDTHHARRVMAIMLPYISCTFKTTHQLTGTARSTMDRWLSWYHEGGLETLRSYRPWQLPSQPIRHMIRALQALIQFLTQGLGCQRSRWPTELFAIEVNRLLGFNITPSMLRRWLPLKEVVSGGTYIAAQGSGL